MKKRIAIIMLLILAVIVTGALLYRFVLTGSNRIADGEYHIKNSAQYPNAKIIVKKGTVQFKDIDLNKIYKKNQLEVYNYKVTNDSVAKLSDDELAKKSDLNRMFVEHAMNLDGDVTKIGTDTYRYVAIDEIYFFGLIFEYDSIHKTIWVGNGGRLDFEMD